MKTFEYCKLKDKISGKRIEEQIKPMKIDDIAYDESTMKKKIDHTKLKVNF